MNENQPQEDCLEISKQAINEEDIITGKIPENPFSISYLIKDSRLSLLQTLRERMPEEKQRPMNDKDREIHLALGFNACRKQLLALLYELEKEV